MQDTKKIFYVAWESIQGNSLDDLALQGPFDINEARKLKQHFHSMGIRASVIQCTSLKIALEKINSLEKELTK